MTINPDLFIVAPMLQDYFVDKDTGFPLAAGIVTFYQDNARTIKKNVYYQSLNPVSQAYEYLAFENPIILTSVGTIADPGGNDVIPYYYPYNEDDETAEPYYVTVYSSTGVEQFTRDNFPYNPNASAEPGDQTLLNYIPNGQFIAHTNIPGGIYPNGTASVTVATGGMNGWTYSKNTGSGDTDAISFDYITEDPQQLTGNTRYAFRLVTTSVNVTTNQRWLAMSFQNVNLFSSPEDAPTTYTFSFEGISNTGATVPVDFILLKNFGTGGSTTQEITMGSVVLLSSVYSTYNIPFTFPPNDAYTIGANNDDYLSLIISFPTTGSFDASVTNFLLTPGAIDVTSYPQEPNSSVFANGIAGSMPTPNPDGSDLYLPIIYTKSGFNFDASRIGDITGSFKAAAGVSQLLCDGTAYETDLYSAVGIPYSRLFNVLYNSGAYGGIPLFGTGAAFVSCLASTGDVGAFYLSLNHSAATSTAATNGSVSTGFTFTTVWASQTSQYPFIASRSGASAITIRNNVISSATLTSATVGTTSLTLTVNQNEQGSYQIVTYSGFNVGGNITASEYFRFYIQGGSYYVWFKVAGSGSDPAPGGTGIEVDLTGNETDSEVTYKVLAKLNGGFFSLITPTTVTAGSYFTFIIAGQTYAVWYSIAGAGTNPTVAGAKYINVNVPTNSAANAIAYTVSTLNSYQFALPNLQGITLRGNDPNQLWDYQSASRFSLTNNTYYGAVIGTTEYDAIQSHNHTTPQGAAGAGNYCAVSGSNSGNVQNSFYGIGETRVINTSVNFYINY